MPPPKQTQDFALPHRLEQQYAAQIHRIVGRVLPPKVKEQSFDDWLKDIAERSQRRDIQDASEVLARRMVSAVNIRNARTWREAAARSQKSRKLYLLLNRQLTGTALGRRVDELVAANAKYISSIAEEQASVLVGQINRAIQQGARPGTIAKMARNHFPKLLRSRVNLIARTESQKISTALTQARSEEVGAEFYLWSTSEDVRVRTSHKKMNDVLIPWNDAPNPEALNGEKSTLGSYHVGSCPNCRCTPLVVLSIDDINWPRRVYHHGSIQQMNKVQFKAAFAQVKGLAA